MSRFIFFFSLLFSLSTITNAQYIDFQGLVKMLNTDNKEAIEKHLQSKGFFMTNMDDSFEYFKFEKIGKWSNNFGQATIVLWKKNTIENVRKISYYTPFSQYTMAIYDEAKQYGFKSDFPINFVSQHPVGDLEIMQYSIYMNTVDDILWENMQAIKVGLITLKRIDKQAWN